MEEVLLLEEVQLLLQLRASGALDGIFGDEVAEMNVEDYRDSLADAEPTGEKKVWLNLHVQQAKNT